MPPRPKKPPSPKLLDWNVIIPAVIGLISAIGVAYLGYLGIRAQTEGKTVATANILPATPAALSPLSSSNATASLVSSVSPGPTEVPTPIVSTETQSPATHFQLPGLIPFGAPDNPNNLSPVFEWQVGSSQASSYSLSLNPGALTMIAGPNTDQWEDRVSAPLLLYPFKGDFEAQVKVIFSPSRDYQVAGIGVRSAQDTSTWIRVTRNFFDGQLVAVGAKQNGKSVPLNGIEYTDNTVYFKIKRQSSLFTLSFSKNGEDWITLQKDYAVNMKTDVQIYLMAYSTSTIAGITAQFYDLAVSNK